MNRWSLILLAVAALLLASPVVAGSRDAVTAEYRIKAAFLYHFCNYVSWPESVLQESDPVLRIGVAGSNDIAAQLQQQIGKRHAQGRSMEVRRIAPGEDISDLHVLYVVDSTTLRSMNVPPDSPILVVTESAHGLASGSVINFVIEQDRVRFDIASDTARRRGLNISAQLFTVARHIRGDMGWRPDTDKWQFFGRILGEPGLPSRHWAELLPESRTVARLALLLSLHDVTMVEPGRGSPG